MNYQEFITEFSKLRPASTFLVLNKYRNAQGELADFNIIFHISYENALKKSLAIVEVIKPENDLQEQAKREVIASLEKSLVNVETDLEELDDGYKRFFDESNNYIKGVKLHIESNILHLYGLIHAKRVIEPVEYPKVNSKPLTIEKKKLLSNCPVSKFRQFRLHPSQLESIKVEKIQFLPPEIPFER